jgi:hypothetical protein
MAELGGEFSEIGITQVTSFLVTGLSYGTIYEFKVLARN